MNDTGSEIDANVRAESYYIACGKAICPHCGSNTRVVALLVPPGHQIRSQDDDDDMNLRRLDSWERAGAHALLFYVESIPDAVRQRMQCAAPMLRYAAGIADEEPHWINHCEHCGGAQEDHELFCEPEGAFVPLDADGASAIELVYVAETLVAVAGGYAPDPEFIEFES